MSVATGIVRRHDQRRCDDCRTRLHVRIHPRPAGPVAPQAPAAPQTAPPATEVFLARADGRGRNVVGRSAGQHLEQRRVRQPAILRARRPHGLLHLRARHDGLAVRHAADRHLPLRHRQPDRRARHRNTGVRVLAHGHARRTALVGDPCRSGRHAAALAVHHRRARPVAGAPRCEAGRLSRVARPADARAVRARRAADTADRGRRGRHRAHPRDRYRTVDPEDAVRHRQLRAADGEGGRRGRSRSPRSRARAAPW